ncbi:hypothetical protein Pyn_41160 [Prunus yedoensis var. nudiflora]|uniref:Uncharacterized protein n=1 Tax=Prunus yedoensis var. nudiflora TaxID=2094558 RepID=A0A314Y4F7_PRUYE|nr:hypothetical protein Pyn_41160 [Prunus yedoensis var. nudiflora]
MVSGGDGDNGPNRGSINLGFWMRLGIEWCRARQTNQGVEVERVSEEREVEVERRAEASLDDEDNLEGHPDIEAPDAETEVLGDGDAKDPDRPRMGYGVPMHPYFYEESEWSGAVVPTHMMHDLLERIQREYNVPKDIIFTLLQEDDCSSRLPRCWRWMAFLGVAPHQMNPNMMRTIFSMFVLGVERPRALVARRFRDKGGAYDI